jgi:hypothetical protein
MNSHSYALLYFVVVFFALWLCYGLPYLSCCILFLVYHLQIIFFPLTSVTSPGSERNINKLTLDGVDVMGERLAEEVCNSLCIMSYMTLCGSVKMEVRSTKEEDCWEFTKLSLSHLRRESKLQVIGNYLN